MDPHFKNSWCNKRVERKVYHVYGIKKKKEPIKADRKNNNEWQKHQKQKCWTGVCFSEDNGCSYWQKITKLRQFTWPLITLHVFFQLATSKWNGSYSNFTALSFHLPPKLKVLQTFYFTMMMEEYAVYWSLSSEKTVTCW